MIRYRLRCKDGHEFEAWFQNSGSFDGQLAGAKVVCPACGMTEVEKAPMAPSLARHARRGGQDPQQAPTEPLLPSGPDPISMLRALRSDLISRAENVGPRFADEARRIHAGEADARSIYGEATIADARDLLDDGIPLIPLPQLPEDRH